MFTIRTSKPSAGNKYYITKAKGGYSQCIQGSPTDSGCNVLSNCVGYACGRFNESIAEMTGVPGMKYPTLNCNAENFIERAKSLGLSVSSTPCVGGIMVWQKGSTLSSSDGAGHVEFVEKVYDNGNIMTSASNYGGTAFYNKDRSNSNGRWGLGSAYSFRGCIINPYVKNVVTSTKTTTTTTQKASTTTSVSGLTKGAQINLNNTPLYASSTTKTASCNKTGKYYIWNANVVNNRVRITNSAANVGVAGKVTGWIDSSVVTSKSTTSTTTSKSTNSTAAAVTYSDGDVIKIASGAKYANGGTIPNWVLKSTLYCRSTPANNTITFSVLKTGAVTGRVNLQYVTKA